MNREKRPAVVPVPYQIPLACYPRKRPKKKKIAQRHIQCAYQSIPFPLKFAYVGGLYAFYGGLMLKERNGTLVTETPLMSQYLRCQEVKVNGKQGDRIINIHVGDNPDFEYPPWQPMVERLKEGETEDMRCWGKLLEDYCVKYEDKLRAWANSKNKNQYMEDQFIKINQESERRIAEYFNSYPCLNFKTVLKGNHIKFTNFIMNEQYLAQLGYSVDNFAISILRDGIPQLIPMDNTPALRLYVENYHSLEKGDCQMPEVTSEMMLRKGYTRKVNFKAHYFATYKDKVFGVDCIMIVTRKDEPVFSSAKAALQEDLSENFLDEAVKQEKEASKFLEQYYNTPFNMKYSNIDRVCGIKELVN